MNELRGVRASERWCLKRQDDHGRQYVMEIFGSKREAEAKMETYQVRGHKQTYWVEKERQG